MDQFLTQWGNPVCLVDHNFNVIWANSVFESRVHLKNSDKLLFDKITACFETGRVGAGDNIGVGLVQTSEKMTVDFIPLYSQDHKVGAVGIFFHTGSDLALPQNQNTDKKEYLGILASGLAHEIKNPLSGILGASQLLGEFLGKTPEAKYAQMIEKEAKRVTNLVENLLDFTKPRNLTKIPCSLSEILYDLVLLQKTSLPKHITIKEEYDPSLPKIMADPQGLTQVFLNLLQNSVQSIKKEGEVTLRTRWVVNFKVKEKGQFKSFVAVDIEDTGCGLSDEERKKLFTPFFTTKPKGTGLGLPISQQIVEEHQGSIEVKSVKGQGSVFSVYLPVY